MFVGFSVALVLTAMFAFRFRGWERPLRLFGYFALFLALEGVSAKFLLPPNVFGSEVGWVCLGLSVPFIVASWLDWRFGDPSE